MHAWHHVNGAHCPVSYVSVCCPVLRSFRRLYVHRVYWSRKGEALPLTLYTAASMSRLKVGLLATMAFARGCGALVRLMLWTWRCYVR